MGVSRLSGGCMRPLFQLERMSKVCWIFKPRVGGEVAQQGGSIKNFFGGTEQPAARERAAYNGSEDFGLSGEFVLPLADLACLAR